MLKDRVRFSFLLLVLALVALSAACDDGGGGDGATPSASPSAGQPTSTPGETPVPTGALNIRDEDLAAQPDVLAFVQGSGGEVDTSRVIYADLTEDGVEDAVVPISSGGEGGDLAVFVLGYQGGALDVLLQAAEGQGGIQAALEDGQLVVTQGVYAASDPLCCPSEVLRRFYRWDADAGLFAIDREERQTAVPR